VDAIFRLSLPLIALRELNWRRPENVCVPEMPRMRGTTPCVRGGCAIRLQQRVWHF
jgi:hypothetical protein